MTMMWPLFIIKPIPERDSRPTMRYDKDKGDGQMSIQYAKPNEIIASPLGAALCYSKTTTVVKTADLELIRLVLPIGKAIPTHQAPCEITVQRLEG